MAPVARPDGGHAIAGASSGYAAAHHSKGDTANAHTQKAPASTTPITTTPAPSKPTAAGAGHSIGPRVSKGGLPPVDRSTSSRVADALVEAQELAKGHKVVIYMRAHQCMCTHIHSTVRADTLVEAQ